MLNLKKIKATTLILMFVLGSIPTFAQQEGEATGAAPDPVTLQALQQAQEKLTSAVTLYNTAKSQERALKDLRRASKLSLKAAKLRSKAEKLQTKADQLIERAKQNAVSNGLMFDDIPMQMQEQMETIQQTASAPGDEQVVPGQPINIIIPNRENSQTALQNGVYRGAPVPQL